MSTPITADETITQLKKWHISYVEHAGWRTRNRNAGHHWGPVNGCVQHHTGDDAPDTNDIAVLLKGKPGVPGPLVQFATDDNGVLHLIGCGRANHAGGGDPRVLDAVVAESYGDRPPATSEHSGSKGAVDGNTHFYGNEATYSGSQTMTDAQYRTCVLLWAAICDFHDWTARSVIGHKEWSDWKSDPGQVEMKRFRVDIQQALDAGPVHVANVTFRAASATHAGG